MPFYRRDAVSPSAVRRHPGAVIPRSEARDPRERIGAALAGISAELAELPWTWPPDRGPRPTKLLLRLQDRVNAERRRTLHEKRLMYVQFSGLSDA